MLALTGRQRLQMDRSGGISRVTATQEGSRGAMRVCARTEKKKKQQL
jgi:hypothetical protein